MREYELQLEIGGEVTFEYAHHASEALERTGKDMADMIDSL